MVINFALFKVNKNGQVIVILLSFGNMLDRDLLDLAQLVFNNSIKRNQEWVPMLINRLQKLGLLFISVTGFCDLCDKIKNA